MSWLSLHRFAVTPIVLAAWMSSMPFSAVAQDSDGLPGLPDAREFLARPPAEESDSEQPAATTGLEDADQAHAEEVAPARSALSYVNQAIFTVLFFDVSFGSIEIHEVDEYGNPLLDKDGVAGKKVVEIPFLVLFLLIGAIFFTFWYGWINIRGFRHAIDIVAGKYDKPQDEGEISHFRALTSALSATVGLGNIAGVAIAIQLGGPGAVFWMLLAAVFGMSAKFSSCVLSQLYRQQNADGTISGGPMYYLDLGLKDMGAKWAGLGKVLAVMFALMVMGGAIGGGNMFQANQTVEAFTTAFGIESDRAPWAIGITLAVFVGAVILGGIKRIGLATSRIVPAMCGLYVLTSLFIILANWRQFDDCIALIFKMAFGQNAFFGGMAGVMVMGIKRAAFSNEAGLGSAAIAHAAAKTDEPVREGLVAMLGPFIDTIVVCLMTALVVIITGAWNDASIPREAGVALTTAAFGSVIPWFPYVLTGCIGLFAYSTMISWCYYGERGWIYLLDHFGGIGLKTVIVFRLVFLAAIVVGAVNKLSDVLDFSDAMILSMAFPNIVGSAILAPRVLRKVKDYWARYKSGEMKPAK
ncbi:MAG: alanine/glycine:cation symporter family protein [Verrucomicrobia bacterium]|nr:alanine/glycine:cation symporter family protein [Verrucomicrobiota bacterium]MDA1085939.1 alanine/glycine:cation symporter family protein [Verrucomicrobiota bacterium]